MPVPLRDRLLDSAAELAIQRGWSGVTMARVGDAAGVSRQSVYNELGAKPQMAELLVERELQRFLSLVAGELTGGPDLPGDLGRAARAVISEAAENPLLQAIVAGSQGADSELLPLLTVESDALQRGARTFLAERVREAYQPQLTADRLEMLADVIVRFVLSHVVQRTDAEAEVSDAVEWVAGAALQSPPGPEEG